MNKLQDFFHEYPIKKFKKNDIVYLQHTNPTVAYGVKSGIVRMYNLTAEGEEKSILFNIRDEVLPVCWLFSKTEQTLYYYQAYTDCELYVIDKEDFLKNVRNNAELAYQLLDAQVQNYVSYTQRINALEQSRAQTKILAILQLLCHRYGKEIREHRVRIEVPFTQHELANFIGLTRETTTIELKKLRDDKVIFCHHKLYTVNTTKLSEMLGDVYNPGVRINTFTNRATSKPLE